MGKSAADRDRGQAHRERMRNQGRGEEIFAAGKARAEKRNAVFGILYRRQVRNQLKRNVCGGDHRKGEPFQMFSCRLLSGKHEKKNLSELACSFLFLSHSGAECWTHRERKRRKGGRRKAGQRLQSVACICAGGERRWSTAKKRRDSPIRAFTGILCGVAFCL